jgi:hypothetical protein
MPFVRIDTSREWAWSKPAVRVTREVKEISVALLYEWSVPIEDMKRESMHLEPNV